jgi:hypothetical protein
MSHFSFTRTKYDSCALNKTDKENIHQLNLNIDPSIQNVSMCHPSVTTLNSYNGAYGVPQTSIDISSELRGQKRIISRCPETRYNPMINCNNCEKCDSGIPCDCSHCKEMKSIKLCDESFNPQFTRLNKPCNIFAGINIDRFDPLCENIQMNAQSLPISGVNTRLIAKDSFEAKRETRQSGDFRPSECKPLNKWSRQCK